MRRTLRIWAVAALAIGCGGAGAGHDGGARSDARAPDAGRSDGAASDAAARDAASPPDARGGDARERVWGVTIDDVSGTADIVEALRALPRRATARVVFDERVAAEDYVAPVTAIHAVSDVLGELLDSSAVASYSVGEYAARADEYLARLGGVVDVWEVGNEINGEWLGGTADVVAKMTAAFDRAQAAGARTALTLYYNRDCWQDADHEMFTWAEANVPARMKQGLDWVLVSFYEDDCNGITPDWPAEIARLGAIFPAARLGLGECGTRDEARKAEYVRRYYGMRLDEPRWIGGWFWWWFREDMVPRTRPLWAVLAQAWAG